MKSIVAIRWGNEIKTEYLWNESTALLKRNTIKK
jgi:hypothetical protein